jgi:ABC-type transporter Mla subunit MlaD
MRAYWTLFVRNLKKGKLPLSKAIISDILLWMALVLALATITYLFAVRIPEQRGQTIVLHFKDANEIIKGSSVQMLGTEIGYVSYIQILQDHVDVTVQTYPHAVPIPAGATFTILFTGLGGSKSIEVSLPADPAHAEARKLPYQVEEPIRMQQLLDANIKVTQSLQEGAENITDFFGKKKPIEEVQVNVHQTQRWSERAVPSIQQFNGYMNDGRQQLRDALKNGLTTMNQLNQQATEAISRTQPSKVRSQIVAGLKNIKTVHNLLVAAPSQSGNTPAPQTIATFLNGLNLTNSKLSAFLAQTQRFVSTLGFGQRITDVENGQTQITQQLVQTDQWLQAHPLIPAFEHARHAIQGFNQQLLKLIAKVEKRKANTPTPSSTPASPSP